MKKKNTAPKLALDHETLRRLDERDLEKIPGGHFSRTCSANCVTTGP